MSQISILGFAPTAPAEAAPGSIHWSILISPLPGSQTTLPPPPRSKKSRFLQRWHSPTQPQQPVFESTLFDMHNHQLRQQQYPVPHEEGELTYTSTDISSSLPDKPLRLAIRIALSTHPNPPLKLATKISNLLYHTPTYGPADDWLRAALEELIYAHVLDDYDVDAVLNYARGAVTAATADRGLNSDSSSGAVQELDYAAHMTRTAQVKDMFSQSRSASTSPSRSARPASKRAPSSSHKPHTFLGFWVTPSPGSGQVRRQQQQRDPQRYSWQRQDDPYGGLM